MTLDQLKPSKILRGPLFAEPVEVIVTTPVGTAVKLVGRGIQSGRVVDVILTDEKLGLIETTPDTEPFDGDAKMFRLGIEAMRLGLAFEYDPYFSLSIARVDPLPHQLEAVYDYFMRLPRIRFLLADDPGAGKTIMAGLLIKELKIRGLVKRTLIITPASLSFQWQREMKDKFRENFEIIRSDILRANYGSNPWQEKNQVVTSVSWVSRIPDAKESLLRSQWDLVIVDEAHKMSAASRDKTTLAYDLGAEMAKRTDHYLLMTATPHKGDPKNFCLFLELLDRDVYGDVGSLEEALKKHEAPFTANIINKQLRRTGAFWLDENFDHAVRSLNQLNHYRRYIADNPAQAHLESGSFALDRGAGILPALEDSATWRPPAQSQDGRQDAYPTGSSQDACSTGAAGFQPALPDLQAVETFLIQQALNPMLAEVTAQRTKETQTISQHLEISLSELINRQQIRLAELTEMQERGDTSQPVAANIKTTEDHLGELNARLDHRRAELERERECMVGDIQHLARAWVLPHPDRKSPQIAPMVSDPEIERIAIQFAIKHEEAQGRVVESVEKDNRGFDLISRKPHPEDPKTAIDVRFIEVKGRADGGDIALTTNEYNTAKRLKKDYDLYVVLHCATTPSLNVLRDPATLDWQPIVKVEHYRLNQDSIKHPIELKEDAVPYRVEGPP